jgi:hypothetical protein
MAQLTKGEYEKLLLIGSESLELPSIDKIQAVRAIAIDNFVTCDERQWSLKTIEGALHSTMGLIGKPFILDHNWHDVQKVQAVIFDAKMLNLKVAPDLIKNTSYQAMNEEIIKAEGYCPLVVSIAFMSDNELLMGQALGSLKSVSFGGNWVKNPQLVCPHDGLQFSDPKCRHLPPNQWYDYDDDYLEEYNYTVADYGTYVGSIWFSELSQVLIPNVPGAQIISREIESFYK